MQFNILFLATLLLPAAMAAVAAAPEANNNPLEKRCFQLGQQCKANSGECCAKTHCSTNVSGGIGKCINGGTG